MAGESKPRGSIGRRSSGLDWYQHGAARVVASAFVDRAKLLAVVGFDSADWAPCDQDR
jgi:hypothetical protein